MLSERERNEITDALERWAKFVPNEPMVGFLGGDGFLTPLQLVQSVKRRTPDGKALLEILELGVRSEGIDKVINRLTQQVS